MMLLHSAVACLDALQALHVVAAHLEKKRYIVK